MEVLGNRKCAGGAEVNGVGSKNAEYSRKERPDYISVELMGPIKALNFTCM